MSDATSDEVERLRAEVEAITRERDEEAALRERYWLELETERTALNRLKATVSARVLTGREEALEDLRERCAAKLEEIMNRMDPDDWERRHITQLAAQVVRAVPLGVVP